MNSILSSRYARSIFDLSVELDILDKISKDFFLIEKVCEENSILNVLLSNPNIFTGVKKSIIQDIFKGKIEELSMKFILLLVDKRRVLHLRDIAREFHSIYNEYHNIKIANLYVANELSESTRNEFQTILEKKFDSDIIINQIIDKRVIGGFKLVIDGMIYDASISKQLSLLKKSFEKNIYEKGF